MHLHLLNSYGARATKVTILTTMEALSRWAAMREMSRVTTNSAAVVGVVGNCGTSGVDAHGSGRSRSGGGRGAEISTLLCCRSESWGLGSQRVGGTWKWGKGGFWAEGNTRGDGSGSGGLLCGLLSCGRGGCTGGDESGVRDAVILAALLPRFHQCHRVVNSGGIFVKNDLRQISIDGIAIGSDQIGIVGTGVEIDEYVVEDAVELGDRTALSDGMKVVEGAFSTGGIEETSFEGILGGEVSASGKGETILAQPR